MSTANVTQTGGAATVAVTVSRGLKGDTGATGAPGTTDYNELDNVPSEFPPEAHTHPVSDITPISSGKLVGRHGGGSGAGQEIGLDGGLEFQGANIRREALTGDVTAAAGSNSTTIANDAVTNAKLANVPTATIKGRATAGTGDPEDLTPAQAIEVIGAATPASVEAQVYPRTLPECVRIAFLGDSLMAGISGLPTDAVALKAGATGRIMAHLDERFTLLKRASGTNFQQGGYVLAEIRDVLVPEVIAADPDVCFVQGGFNDIATTRGQYPNLDMAAADMFNKLEQICLALRTQGIRVIVATITPEAFPTDTNYPPASGYKHPDYRIIRAKYNDLIRKIDRNLATVCDWGNLLAVDPNDDLSLADPGYLLPPTDYVHYNYLGNAILGRFAADVIAQNFTLGEEFAIADAASSTWWTLNNNMTGDVSGLATSFSILISGGVTVTATKNADGSQRLVCSDGALPGDNTKSFRLRIFRSTTSNLLDGKTYRGIVDLRPAADDWAVWALGTRLELSGTTSRVSEAPGVSNPNILNTITENQPHSSRLLFVSTPIVHPGNTGSSTRSAILDLRIFGSGTFDIVRMGIEEVTP